MEPQASLHPQFQLIQNLRWLAKLLHFLRDFLSLRTRCNHRWELSHQWATIRAWVIQVNTQEWAWDHLCR